MPAACHRETRHLVSPVPEARLTVAPMSATQAFRTVSPGHDGWAQSVRPEDPNKLLVVSADCHATEPSGWMDGRLPEEFAARLPKLSVNDRGESFIVTEGNRPWKLQKTDYEGEDLERYLAGKTPADRLRD
ncbi:MAG: amidohydrolase, partial [Acidimicrobiia bacterium]|nr:amidohydrolase [Acidimicrobiia bacterium]